MRRENKPIPLDDHEELGRQLQEQYLQMVALVKRLEKYSRGANPAVTEAKNKLWRSIHLNQEIRLKMELIFMRDGGDRNKSIPMYWRLINERQAAEEGDK